MIVTYKVKGSNPLLATTKIKSSRCKMQVLDLRNVHRNFWSLWSGAEAGACSPWAMNETQSVEDFPGTGGKRPLKVLVDLCLKETALDEFHTCLLLWVKQRQGLLRLCCRKLDISSLPICVIDEVLRMVELDCIQEVRMDRNCDLLKLASFAPFLGRMSNLRKLLLHHVFEIPRISPEEMKEIIVKIASHFAKLHHLQELYVESAVFLEVHVHVLLRCLKTPFETLSIHNGWLYESDMSHLFQCLSISQLKHLDLRGICLIHVSPESLRVLVESVAVTLQTLDLQDCWMTNPQLNAILPALSHCSQLRAFSFYGNYFSMAALKDLLRHTANLANLSLEMYPAPLESYDPDGDFQWGTFVQLRAELMVILRVFRQPKLIWFSSYPCVRCTKWQSCHWEGTSCYCSLPV
ncbi:PREDICTED: PRAME family member 12-like [Galeopterus variegatus]|uniref:PRAME family member 12-like n=1 Tax=Galeopterus variegatus TaxID=482537 RepID=A0ABM0RS41_GALVR|nr:PREDICTED: PRAME family member 12-like [Galeopterus variegatus]